MADKVKYKVTREHTGDDYVTGADGQETLKQRHFQAGDIRTAEAGHVAQLIKWGVLVEATAEDIAVADARAQKKAPKAPRAPKAAGVTKAAKPAKPASEKAAKPAPNKAEPPAPNKADAPAEQKAD